MADGSYRRLYSQGFRTLPRDDSFVQSWSENGWRGTFLNSNSVKCVFRSSWWGPKDQSVPDHREGETPTLDFNLNPIDEMKDTKSSTSVNLLATSATFNSPLSHTFSYVNRRTTDERRTPTVRCAKLRGYNRASSSPSD